MPTAFAPALPRPDRRNKAEEPRQRGEGRIMSSDSLSGRVALVTGASRGIGAAIADQLAAGGAQVVGTATSEAGAERIRQRLAQAATPGDGRVLDVTDAGNVTELLKQVTADYGAPTIVVNNAGITRDNLLLRLDEDAWNGVIDANLSGVYRVCKAAL